MVPRDVNILPWFSGYAEAINAGKSLRNEDQAAFHRGVLRTQDLPEDENYATGEYTCIIFFENSSWDQMLPEILTTGTPYLFKIVFVI